MAKRKAASKTTARSKSAYSGPGIAEEYLSDLKAIRATGAGVPETSYYPALANLFNAIGKTLKPKVRCIIHTKNQGAGIPDGGLFTADQFQRQADTTPRAGQLPSRGAMEVKPASANVSTIAQSQQVKGYLKTYGIVIVTNLRDFLIVERGPRQRPVERESFSLAADEQDFWQHKVAHPRAAAQQRGEQFIEFIKRACLHNAPLTNPKDVAWFLASYARDALVRVEHQKQLPALQSVRAALEQALGMKFTADSGEHFFRSTLVQTIFYGVFSAWVLWHRTNPEPKAKFNWKNAAWTLHVPFIRTLYEELAKPSRLRPLGLVEVLEWTAAALNRVDRAEFFGWFQGEHAVQYFYEPFLEAYDPELRKWWGVWYTPPEIVKYQVARVDTVLRDELNLPDGLADPNVIVLDPCCGTGAYLVEVLNRIAATLREKGGDALIASDLKKAAKQRVFGFEIMPAPFVVSHLQLGLMLQAWGAPLSHKAGERVGVYLTNALTGWEPPKGVKATPPLYPELTEEREAAEEIKRQKKILVVLGNPPYNAFAGVSPEEEQGLVEIYKGVYFTEKRTRKGQPKRDRHYRLSDATSKGGWGIRKFNLDDLYVRFFRLAERRIAEMTGQGVVSFISNFSYLGDPSFVVMRERFLSEFDTLWLDCMNGDSRETGKRTPEGKPDPSVFSTEYNRQGIRVGTAICVIVRKPDRQKKPTVRFRHFWGASKRADLLASLNDKDFNAAYKPAKPSRENRFSFRPENVSADYNEWPAVVALCEEQPISGLQEMRKGALMDMVKEALVGRLHAYFDEAIDWATFSPTGGGLAVKGGRFDAKACRSKLLASAPFSEGNIRRYSLYPFDNRWCYHTNTRPLWNEPRPDLALQCWAGNSFFVTRAFAERPHEWGVMTVTPGLPDYHLLRPNAVAIPIRLRTSVDKQGTGQNDLFNAGAKPLANLSKATRAYLAKLRVKDPDKDAKLAGLIWMHALAIGYSPAYLSANADGIRRDWPRIPLPESRKALEASAALGERVAALLDTENEVPGVTSGKLGALFKTIGPVSKVGGGSLDPSAGDLEVLAGWGYAQKTAVMPGQGKTQTRKHADNEKQAIEAEAAARGLTVKQVMKLLGPTTLDVYLNSAAYWRNIPANVWDFHIGGYQVIKKWLSYRERDLLGRALKPEEAREVTAIARRIAAIILLQPTLDENYRAVKASTFAWATALEPGQHGARLEEARSAV